MEQWFELLSLVDWLVPFMAFLLCCPQWTCQGTACSFPLFVVQIEVETVADYCSKSKEPGKYPCGRIYAEINLCLNMVSSLRAHELTQSRDPNFEKSLRLFSRNVLT